MIIEKILIINAILKEMLVFSVISYKTTYLKYLIFNRILEPLLKNRVMIIMKLIEMIKKNHFQKFLNIILEIL